MLAERAYLCELIGSGNFSGHTPLHHLRELTLSPQEASAGPGAPRLRVLFLCAVTIPRELPSWAACSMNGADLVTFTQELNGGASIGDTLAYQLLNLAKAMVEQRRPWMILRHTDSSIAATAATNGWQTAVDLSSITRFNRF